MEEKSVVSRLNSLVEELKAEVIPLDELETLNVGEVAQLIKWSMAPNNEGLMKEHRRLLSKVFSYARHIIEAARKLGKVEEMSEYYFDRVRESLDNIQFQLATDTRRLDILETVFPDIRKQADEIIRRQTDGPQTW